MKAMDTLIVHPVYFKVLDGIISSCLDDEVKFRKEYEIGFLLDVLKLLAINKARQFVTLSNDNAVWLLKHLPSEDITYEAKNNAITLILKHKLTIKQKDLFRQVPIQDFKQVRNLLKFLFILYRPYEDNKDFFSFLGSYFPNTFKKLKEKNFYLLGKRFYKMKESLNPKKHASETFNNPQEKTTKNVTKKPEIVIKIASDFKVSLNEAVSHLPESFFLSKKMFKLLHSAYIQLIKFVNQYKSFLPRKPVVPSLIVTLAVAIYLSRKYKVYLAFEDGLIGLGMAESLNEVEGLYINTKDPTKYEVHALCFGSKKDHTSNVCKINFFTLYRLLARGRPFQFFAIPLFQSIEKAASYKFKENDRPILHVLWTKFYGNTTLLAFFEKADPTFQEVANGTEKTTTETQD